MREKLDAWVDSHTDEIIAKTQAVLRIPGVEDTSTVSTGAPFGRAIADSLEYTLSLCEELGMATENFDGYAGHATFGEGEEIVAMLGHLDVVPAGKGWTYDPWGATLADGFLYGRGTSDDKGPTYAALFGAKAVLDSCKAEGITLSRRIRLIFGTDEESGWQCMRHYFGAAGQPKPTLAFTPDASFPLIYAEKGSFTATATKTIPESDGPLRLVSLHAGLRANMVPDEAVAVIEGDVLPIGMVAETLEEEGFTVTWNDAESLTVVAKGKSAHGATPASGINAAVKLMEVLADIELELPAADVEWMTDLVARADTTGATLGISGRDDVTTPLTSNFGVLKYEDHVVQATFNIRYPATWDGDKTTGKFTASLAETGWTVPPISFTPPLYVPRDQEPVKTLLKVYREQTGDMSEPFTIGGRTYATVVAPVGVAFGPSMPGDEKCAHQADERFRIERLIQCAKIYAQALYELAK